MPFSLRTHTTYRTISTVHLFLLLTKYSFEIKWFITWRQIKLQADVPCICNTEKRLVVLAKT